MVRLNNSNFGRLPFQVIGIMIWMYFQVDLGSRQQQQPATGRSQTRVSQDIIILVSYMTLKRPRRPSFGLLGLPFGGVGRELQALGIDFAAPGPERPSHAWLRCSFSCLPGLIFLGYPVQG